MLALIPLVISNWRIVFVVGAVCALIGLGLYTRSHLIAEGEQAALQKVESANAQAQDAAARAAQTVDACFNAGGAWDRDAGVCHPAAGH